MPHHDYDLNRFSNFGRTSCSWSCHGRFPFSPLADDGLHTDWYLLTVRPQACFVNSVSQGFSSLTINSKLRNCWWLTWITSLMNSECFNLCRVTCFTIKHCTPPGYFSFLKCFSFPLDFCWLFSYINGGKKSDVIYPGIIFFLIQFFRILTVYLLGCRSYDAFSGLAMSCLKTTNLTSLQKHEPFWTDREASRDTLQVRICSTFTSSCS